MFCVKNPMLHNCFTPNYEKKKCLGKDKCPLNGDHPIVYGPENIFAIGCSRCLDDKLKQSLKWQFYKRKY